MVISCCALSQQLKYILLLERAQHPPTISQIVISACNLLVFLICVKDS